MGRRCPKILLVEDNTAVAFTLKEGIEQFCAAEVVCAETGNQAKHILLTQQIDLALIDTALPDIIGFEIANEAVHNDVPVLLISGFVHHQQIAILCGFPFLHKPLHPSKLAALAMATIADAATNINDVKKSYEKLQGTRRGVNTIP